MENEFDNGEDHDEMVVVMIHRIAAEPLPKIDVGESEKIDHDAFDDEEGGAVTAPVEQRWVPNEVSHIEPRWTAVRPFKQHQFAAPGDDDQEIYIIYEGPGAARIAENLPGDVQSRNNQPTAPPAPAARTIGDALERLRDLGLHQPVGEDEGYVSGKEEDLARVPSDERLRAGPFLQAAHLVNFDVRMMEMLNQQWADPRPREEPILIENNNSENQPPFHIQIYLGEFGNPLPPGLATL
ncbi:hypothetical protein QAD02_000260 [Eretmocerus hayati]|uniref:Uncharacterized protein n=1 Tax=Eretmocerus hayati TaxID=131215 RepID=A0ACC2NDM3_9HYME|nr:hypothetical protein QAD02_000260 [Eretmocerus hayati]